MYKLLLIIFFLLPFNVSAIGISVSPSTLTMSGSSNKEITTELLVSNPSHDVAIIDIYADDFDEIININPTSFILSSGDQKKINITVNSKRAGVSKTTVSIVATPVSSYTFKASSGIKVPMEMTIFNKNNNMAAVFMSLPGAIQSFGLLAILGVLGLLFIKRRS